MSYVNKIKYFLFLFLLFVPSIGFSYYTRGVWDPCGWWGTVDYLLVWRKERFYPPLAQNDPSTLLFGDAFAQGAAKGSVRLDGGMWLTRCLGVGASTILIRNDPIDYFEDTNGAPLLAQPYLDPVTLTPNSLQVGAYGSIEVHSVNHFWNMDCYVRYNLLNLNYWKVDALGGLVYMRLEDNLDITSNGMDFTTRKSDHFDCVNDFYAGEGGIWSEFASSCWRLNLWGKVAFGNMVQQVEVHGDFVNAVGAGVGGLYTQPTNIGNHPHNEFEVAPILGANLTLRVWSHFNFSVGYIWLYFPKIALSGEQVDPVVNDSQFDGGPLVGTAAPLVDIKQKSFWIQGISIGVAVYY